DDPEIQEVGREVWAREKFRGEIRDDACFVLAASFHRAYALLVNAIADAECESRVDIVWCRRHGWPPEAAKEIVDERLPEIGNAHSRSDAYTRGECTRLQAEGIRGPRHGLPRRGLNDLR